MRSSVGTRSGLSSAAALIGVAALVVSTVPAAAADPRPGPGQIIPGQRTSTPVLVNGVREKAEAKGSAAGAALRHLADRQSRYRIAQPERDLKLVQSVSNGPSEVVRFQQLHRGVDVLGGQYVVRMENKGGERTVTGASGRYFTGLTVSTEPGVDAKTAIARAVMAVGEQGHELSGTDQGLVVLPRGSGVLTRHVTVRGTDPTARTPVLYEVYIEAQSGYPVLQYSGIRAFGGPGAMEKGRISQDAPRGVVAPSGSGVKLDGTTVELHVDRDEARKEYVLRDRSRSDGRNAKHLVSTWDARGLNVIEVIGGWPPGLKEFGSPTSLFGPAATDTGAVDAHWGAGKVVDYYRQVLGRDGLDGRGGNVNSVVLGDGHYRDAVWDGTKVVYDGGDREHRPFSAGLDVVGQQLTYGVVGTSAGLVPAGQSGALEVAIGDYFGKAVATDAYGIPMDSPDSGLMGATLCRTKSPRECAFRDLGDGRSTSKSFVGVTIETDNGGVHLNSTIFSGALWDIRKDLDHVLADRIVYKALTEYLTPLDGFTEGRNAVLAAARDLKATAGQLRSIERAFNGHGIVQGWELALGVDSDPLLGNVSTDRRSTVGAGGGWWAAATSNEDGSEPYSVWAGRLDGSGEKKLISPNDGRYHVDPVTDGRTVVWKAYRRHFVDILARPLAGGPIRTLYSTAEWNGGISSLRVEGQAVAFALHRYKGGSRVVYLRIGETDPVFVPPGGPGSRWAFTGAPSLSHGRIAFTDCYRTVCQIELLDIASGNRTVLSRSANPQATAVTSRHVYWLDRPDWPSGLTAVRRVNLDGTGGIDISPATGKNALQARYLTASDDAVTVGTEPPAGEVRQETLARLWQFTSDGTRRERVSCNRGEQVLPASVGGRHVVWIDATTGSTGLVTRIRPAGSCG
ncbi:M4 family metallopeptidase [Streptomyces gamaensis]|uniref:M4 family metallopeptidase n=1 Tax=Streptomyces gamaensis TaxID=1763542 RepID=A0ABW0Z0Q7_9ACTN